MKLADCVVTFDTGVPILRPVKAREQFDRRGISVDVTGSFSYQDEVQWTPARIRALTAMFQQLSKGQ